MMIIINQDIYGTVVCKRPAYHFKVLGLHLDKFCIVGWCEELGLFVRTVGCSCSWPRQSACSLLTMVVSLPLCLLTVQTTFHFACWLFRQPSNLPVDCSDRQPFYLLTVETALLFCLLTAQTACCFSCWQLRQPVLPVDSSDSLLVACWQLRQSAVLPVGSWDSLLFCLLTVETVCCFACWQLRQPAVLPVDSWDSLLFCLLAVETACCFACWQLRQPAVLPVDSWNSLLFCLLTVETACCLRQPAVLPVDSWDSLLFCLLTVETACCFACWQFRQPAVLPVDSGDPCLLFFYCAQFALLPVGFFGCLTFLIVLVFQPLPLPSA